MFPAVNGAPRIFACSMQFSMEIGRDFFFLLFFQRRVLIIPAAKCGPLVIEPTNEHLIVETKTIFLPKILRIFYLSLNIKDIIISWKWSTQEYIRSQRIITVIRENVTDDKNRAMHVCTRACAPYSSYLGCYTSLTLFSQC